MKGKILFCSTDYALENDINEFSIKLQITHYTNKGLLTGFVHVPHLAPSEQLLNITNNKWKKLRFTEEEKLIMKNGLTGTWWDLYKPRFLEETSERNDFQAAYERLKELLNKGNNIICVCYCNNDKYCHRRIIGEMLEEDGYNILIN